MRAPRRNSTRVVNGRKAAVAAALVLAAAAVPAAWATLTPTPVLNAQANEWLGGAATDAPTGDEFIVFSRSRPGKPHVYDAFVRRIGTVNSTVKLNLRGKGFEGDVALPRVAYQQVNGDASDIRFYDVTTGTRSTPPAGVNTNRWEYEPRLGGDWILFVRQANRIKRLILFNLVTRESRILSTVTRWAHSLYPGQIAGDWAVWSRCAPKCVTVRYAIGTQTKQTVAAPTNQGYVTQYAPSITPAGVVYLVRSGNGCGVRVKLVRFYGATDPATGTVLRSYASGHDASATYARPNTDGSTDVFFEDGRCIRRVYMNVFKVTDPAP